MRLFILGLLAAFPAISLAQTSTLDQPITTIRPRQTDTTNIVPAGRFQLELGADFDFGSRASSRSNDYGLGVLRYGISSRLEARVLLPTYSTYDKDLSFQEGFGDVAISVSYLLGQFGKTSLAIRPQLLIPSGVEIRRPDEVSPSLFLTGETEAGHGWKLASTVGWTHVKFSFGSFKFDEDFYRTTLCLERNFGTNVSGFTEYVGEYSKAGEPFNRSNTGVRYRLSPQSQVDFHVMVPLGNTQPNAFGVGYAVRF